jgi:hypothetical protein
MGEKMKGSKNPQKRAFVLGGSGATGLEVIKFLIEDKTYGKVFVPTRKELDLKHQKIHYLPFESIFKPWEFNETIDEFFYCFGSTKHKAGSVEAFKKLEIKIAHQALWLAKELKIKNFFLMSSQGVHPLSMVAYLQVKAEVEKIIKDHHFPSLYIYRPNLLLTPRKEKRWGELIAQKMSSPFAKWWQRYWPKTAPIRVDQVARTMMYDAHHPESGFHIRDNKQILELSILYKE